MFILFIYESLGTFDTLKINKIHALKKHGFLNDCDRDRIQTCNRWSRNPVRYSVAPRGRVIMYSYSLISTYCCLLKTYSPEFIMIAYWLEQIKTPQPLTLKPTALLQSCLSFHHLLYPPVESLPYP